MDNKFINNKDLKTKSAAPLDRADHLKNIALIIFIAVVIAETAVICVLLASDSRSTSCVKGRSSDALLEQNNVKLYSPQPPVLNTKDHNVKIDPQSPSLRSKSSLGRQKRGSSSIPIGKCDKICSCRTVCPNPTPEPPRPNPPRYPSPPTKSNGRSGAGFPGSYRGDGRPGNAPPHSP